MIDHLGINCTDLRACRGVLRPGPRRARPPPDHGRRAWPSATAPRVPTSGSAPSTGVGPNREVHVAFSAPDAATVRAWHAEAMAVGAESLHEPRLWPEYHAAYYGAFVRDTEGNNIEVFLHTGDS